MKGFTLGLGLKQRRKATRKSPIAQNKHQKIPNRQEEFGMVSEPRKQSMAWMETDFSKRTHFQWKIKWRLEHLSALGIMGETAPLMLLMCLFSSACRTRRCTTRLKGRKSLIRVSQQILLPRVSTRPEAGKKCLFTLQSPVWCVYDKDHMSALRMKNTSESDPRGDHGFECRCSLGNFLGFICNCF